MKSIIQIITILLLGISQFTLSASTTECDQLADQIWKHLDNSFDVITKQDVSIDLRISRSKKQLKKARKKIKQAIANGCQKGRYYLTLADIERKLAKYDQAEKWVMTYLEKEIPQWKSLTNESADVRSDLGIALDNLINIEYARQNERTYFQNIREQRGYQWVCGTVSTEYEFDNYIHRAKLLQKKYGNLFGLKYLSTRGIAINGTAPMMDARWETVWSMVKECLSTLKQKKK